MKMEPEHKREMEEIISEMMEPMMRRMMKEMMSVAKKAIDKKTIVSMDMKK